MERYETDDHWVSYLEGYSVVCCMEREIWGDLSQRLTGGHKLYIVCFVMHDRVDMFFSTYIFFMFT